MVKCQGQKVKINEHKFEIVGRLHLSFQPPGLYILLALLCCEIRSAEMMYALDQISITANDLKKLNDTPSEVNCTSLYYRTGGI